MPNIIEITFYFLTNITKLFDPVTQPEIQDIEEDFLKTVLNLIYSSLNYDFLAEKQDSTEIFIDEYAPLQIPNNKTNMKSPDSQSKWSILANESTINLFFQNFLISERFFL